MNNTQSALARHIHNESITHALRIFRDAVSTSNPVHQDILIDELETLQGNLQTTLDVVFAGNDRTPEIEAALLEFRKVSIAINSVI